MRDSQNDILEVIGTELMPRLFQTSSPQDITAIHFYGAGCIAPFYDSVRQALEHYFPAADIHIYSDLLGAARALCGKGEGIACILGTGSNSCLCNGGEIVQNISPLGYILGDEGSGAVLGRTLLAEMLKGTLQHLWPAFAQRYGLDTTDIISKVYRQPGANRFLASLAPFITDNVHLPEVEGMVTGEFVRFLQRNVLPYGRTTLPVNFVGGIATSFASQLGAACRLCGLSMGQIISNPAPHLLNYHTNAI